MIETRAQRTLVKSPPELWAEISDVDTLARHLGEFGEVRITRIEPETTVAWEGETARGTVELEASGWGTKVTLTAELAQAEPEPVDPEPAPQATAPEPEPTPEVLAVPEPADTADEPPASRPGFFARLFGRREKPAPAAEPVVVEPEAIVPEPEPEPEPIEPEPEPAPVEPEPSAALPQVADPEAVLTAVLDDLGSAHHRPFSRG